MIDLSYVWLSELLQSAAAVELDETQLERVVRDAERKLIDLLDVAQENALANGRERIMRHDLPLTKGLRRTMRETALLTREIDVDPTVVFRAQIRASHTIDEMVRAEMPRLIAALLVLAAQILATMNPADLTPDELLRLLARQRPNRPTAWELERAERVLDLTL